MWIGVLLFSDNPEQRTLSSPQVEKEKIASAAIKEVYSHKVEALVPLTLKEYLRQGSSGLL